MTDLDQRSQKSPDYRRKPLILLDPCLLDATSPSTNCSLNWRAREIKLSIPHYLCQRLPFYAFYLSKSQLPRVQLSTYQEDALVGLANHYRQA